MSATTAIATVSWSRQARDPYFIAGISIYLAFILIALFADWIAPNAPKDILFLDNGSLANALPPSAQFPLGTTTSGCGIIQPLAHSRGGGASCRSPAKAFESAQETRVAISAGLSEGSFEKCPMPGSANHGGIFL